MQNTCNNENFRMVEWRWNVVCLIEALTDLEEQPNNILLVGYIEQRTQSALRAISTTSE